MLTQLTRLCRSRWSLCKGEKISFKRLFPVFRPSECPAYEKIRNSEAEIIEQVEAKMRTINPSFINAAGDFTQTWRERTSCSYAMQRLHLWFNDPDRQEGKYLIIHHCQIL